MNLSPQQAQLLKEQFSQELNALLLNMRDKALAQLDYNLRRNVPQDIIQPGEVVSNAINHGIVSAVSFRHKWGIEPSIQLAAELLQDVNAHAEAKLLFDLLSV